MFYSGHKKAHGLNFLGMVMANGLLPFMSFAALGKDHDSRGLHESGFYNKMDNLDMVTVPAKYVAFADPAFKISNHVQKGFQGILTPLQELFDRDCNKSRVSHCGVELRLCADPFLLDFVPQGPPDHAESGEQPLARSMHPQQLQGVLRGEPGQQLLRLRTPGIRRVLRPLTLP